MDPITAINVLTASISMAEKLLPLVNEMKAKGQISPEQQQAVVNSYNSLKARADGQFSGPEWDIS